MRLLRSEGTILDLTPTPLWNAEPQCCDVRFIVAYKHCRASFVQKSTHPAKSVTFSSKTPSQKMSLKIEWWTVSKALSTTGAYRARERDAKGAEGERRGYIIYVFADRFVCFLYLRHLPKILFTFIFIGLRDVKSSCNGRATVRGTSGDHNRMSNRPINNQM